MTLKDWMAREVAARGLSSTTELVEEMRRVTGVSTVMIAGARLGRKFGRYSKAKAISDYTGGVVSVKELCEG